MNRKVWSKKYFSNKNPVNYLCPQCNIGILTLTALSDKISPGQLEMQNLGYPYGIEYIFSGLLECKNLECKQVVSISGKVLRDIQVGKELPNGELVEERISEYYPKFFYPPLEIIFVSSKISKRVAEQLRLSFSHFFNDYSSCANRIRNCIELILDDLKAPSKFKKNNQLKSFRTLHQRIEHYQISGNKKISKLMLAIKIIGNEGSHIGEVTLDDILDAYEFLEPILNYVYDKNDKAISLKADKIVQSNKPRSKHL